MKADPKEYRKVLKRFFLYATIFAIIYLIDEIFFDNKFVPTIVGIILMGHLVYKSDSIGKF